MESLAAALMPNTDGSSTEAPSPSSADLNRLLDEITFRLERRFLLRLFDKHGVPSSQLDKLPPVPKCLCQCNSQCRGRDVTSSAPSTSGGSSGYEDIEILRYKARMVVDNAVGGAVNDVKTGEKRISQYSECDTSGRSVETDMFATIGGPDNMSATNSLYVVRRAALRTLLKYTCKGKAGALLHLTDYLQQQIDSIDEVNADLDVKAKSRKPKVRFDPLMEERNEEFDDTLDEYDDILEELPVPKDRSKKKVVKIQAASIESQSDPVSLDSNYTFNLRKTARHSLSKYLHKADAAGAMMHLFDSTTRLELADDFAEIHASDSDMQELLHTPCVGSIASSGAAPKKQHASTNSYSKRSPQSAQRSEPSRCDKKSPTVRFSMKLENSAENYYQPQQAQMDRPTPGKAMPPPTRFCPKEDSRRYQGKSQARDDRYGQVCTYCQSYLEDIDANRTTNNSNQQRPTTELKDCPNIQCTRPDDCTVKQDMIIDMPTRDTLVGGASTKDVDDEATSSGCPADNGHSESNQLDSKPFEYNPSPKKVIRLHGGSTSSNNHHQDIDVEKDVENSVSQKVGYFDRVLNPEDVQSMTKKAESIDMSEETRDKVGFWEKMCGCCHSNPYKK